MGTHYTILKFSCMSLFADEVFDQFTNFIWTPKCRFQIWYFGTLHVVVLTMSDTKRSANNSGSKRSLPSWTNSRENESDNSAKKPTLDGQGEKFGEAETPNKSKVQNQNGGKSSASCLESKSFNKLLVLGL